MFSIGGGKYDFSYWQTSRIFRIMIIKLYDIYTHEYVKTFAVELSDIILGYSWNFFCLQAIVIHEGSDSDMLY